MRTQTLGQSSPTIGPKLGLLDRNRARWTPWLSSALSFSLLGIPQLARSYDEFSASYHSPNKTFLVLNRSQFLDTNKAAMDDSLVPTSQNIFSSSEAPNQQAGQQAGQKASPNDAKISKAMALFQKGVELYNEAKYEEALDAFLDAQTLYPSPDFQYNIGSCHEQLEQYPSAVRAFKTYLRNKTNVADAANVRARIRRLEKLSEIQGNSREESASQLKTPATVHPVQSQTEASREAEHTRPTDPSLQRHAVNAHQKNGRGLVIGGGAVAGVGVLGGFVGSLVFGLRAAEKSRVIDSISDGNNEDQLTLAEAKEIDRQGRNAEMMQWVSAGIGAGLFVAGAAILSFGLIKRQKSQRFSLRPGVSGRSAFVQLSGRF